ncbi:MAG: hypothetical protein WAZ27_03290 [Minisyncoccia bacterium]
MTRFGHILKWEIPALVFTILAIVVAYDHSMLKSYLGSVGMGVLGGTLILSAWLSGKETHMTKVLYIAGAAGLASSMLLFLFVLLEI